MKERGRQGEGETPGRGRRVHNEVGVRLGQSQEGSWTLGLGAAALRTPRPGDNYLLFQWEPMSWALACHCRCASVLL